MVTTLYDEFINIFGEYEPIIGIDPVSGSTFDCINFGYIGCVLFAIVCMYCVLRIIGSMFRRI